MSERGFLFIPAFSVALVQPYKAFAAFSAALVQPYKAFAAFSAALVQPCFFISANAEMKKQERNKMYPPPAFVLSQLFVLGAYFTFPTLIRYSAICTALRAAPLRIWSPLSQKVSPFSSAKSLRTRPT